MPIVSDTGLALNVLLVENNPEIAMDFQRAFGNMVILIAVSDCPQALNVLREGHSIDVVLFNDTLDSSVFLAEVQRRRYLRALPIIILTDRPVDEFTRGVYREYILDVFPLHDSQTTIRTRLAYLIQKKRYIEAGPTVDNSVLTRMPVGKRAFDVAVSMTALAVLSPLLTVVSVLVRLDSKGPVFYRSKRVGAGYRQFDMYKFRTMRTDADQLLAGMESQNLYHSAPVAEPADRLCDRCWLSGTDCQRPLYADNGQQICEDVHQHNLQAKAKFMKFRADPRVTKLGRFLRNSSIDELPQLINILRGDMSFVGNRPLPPYEAEKLTTIGYARRFAAPAGLTGLWQVTKRGKADMSESERISLDALYAKKYSLRTDLYILLRTVVALWQKENV